MLNFAWFGAVHIINEVSLDKAIQTGAEVVSDIVQRAQGGLCLLQQLLVLPPHKAWSSGQGPGLLDGLEEENPTLLVC